MRTAFFASCLLLASGLVSSASAATADVPMPAAQVLELYNSIHAPVDTALPPPSTDPCTVSCWNAPQISCSSQTGNCVKGQGLRNTYIYYIGCDGQFFTCPY